MKLKFKQQAYQANAVEAVADCFIGQPPATATETSYQISSVETARFARDGWKNAELNHVPLLQNIKNVQGAQNLPISEALVETKAAKLNLDIEMETGTGKTYCYIKTIFELNKRYGWSKFIIVVPSIAIREGVAKTLEITAEHFLETYHKKARFFIYNSKQLHQLESFSSDAGINVMVINVQAFNATGKDARRIYEELDEFQSRKPIDVIAENRPILILDEPQKMEGSQTLKSLEAFNALMILRYSATHKTTHNKIHRLDALDAYNQKLVKKISVRGISVKGQAGTAGYLYLEAIEISPNKPPVARVEFEQKLKSGEIKRVVRKLAKGDDLYSLSKQLEQYRDGYVVSDINANSDSLHFTMGLELSVGDACGDVSEATMRRIQIREAIRAHFDKEALLFQQGIKVLSLFFIDEVAKYRDYSRVDEKGEYAHVFEEEYTRYLSELVALGDSPYIQYLKSIAVEKTHSGYFSIDKKSKRLTDPSISKRGESAGQSDDVDAYDLILKDKERLLSFEEPVRFLFSHSALREGWDNPNVFVICALKHSDHSISRRQEVGRGLRLCVNQSGERMDNPSHVHDINVLTVVVNESYHDFVSALQRDIYDSLSSRPRIADLAYFMGKILKTKSGDVLLTEILAKHVHRYLSKNDYIDVSDHITSMYHDARKSESLAELPKELILYAEQVFQLIDRVFSEEQLPKPGNDKRDKKNQLNANFEKKEFKELWSRINRKAIYRVSFEESELVQKAIDTLNHENTGLRVTPLRYTVQRGEQNQYVHYDALEKNEGFVMQETILEKNSHSIHSNVAYDLIGKITEATMLTRRTIAEILKGLNPAVFAQFRTNPESFIAQAIRLINEQKATMVIEHLAYNPIEDKYDLNIFTAGQTKQDFGNATEKLQRHIYDYVLTDSNIERQFAKELDTCSDVVVYAKLPKGFFIPTPVGNYNPDWAISFKDGAVKHVYFVAETKGSMSSMDLRPIEATRIECARKFFVEISKASSLTGVKYDVVDNFESLMNLIQ